MQEKRVNSEGVEEWVDRGPVRRPDAYDEVERLASTGVIYGRRVG